LTAFFFGGWHIIVSMRLSLRDELTFEQPSLAEVIRLPLNNPDEEVASAATVAKWLTLADMFLNANQTRRKSIAFPSAFVRSPDCTTCHKRFFEPGSQARILPYSKLYERQLMREA
jgi:hypothetical protein